VADELFYLLNEVRTEKIYSGYYFPWALDFYNAGNKGDRVNRIVDELNGEKIDIITWDADPVKFITNALAPAKVEEINIDEQPEKIEYVKSLGFTAAPVIEAGDLVFSGFQPAKLKTII